MYHDAAEPVGLVLNRFIEKSRLTELNRSTTNYTSSNNISHTFSTLGPVYRLLSLKESLKTTYLEGANRRQFLQTVHYVEQVDSVQHTVSDCGRHFHQPTARQATIVFDLLVGDRDF